MVGSAQATEGVACAHLSVPKTLQVALREGIKERGEEEERGNIIRINLGICSTCWNSNRIECVCVSGGWWEEL